jgi:hypothetical protein
MIAAHIYKRYVSDSLLNSYDIFESLMRIGSTRDLTEIENKYKPDESDSNKVIIASKEKEGSEPDTIILGNALKSLRLEHIHFILHLVATINKMNRSVSSSTSSSTVEPSTTTETPA